MPKEKPLLQIKVHGKFKPGRIPVPLLVKICGEVQTAVNRQAQALEGKRTKRPGPVIAAVARECTLELFGIQKGSTTLDFAREAEQQPLIESQTRSFEAVNAVVSTLHSLSRPKRSSPVPDVGVLDTFNNLGDVFDKGVNKIDLIVPRHNGTKRAVAQYVPEVRKTVAARIKQPAINVPSIDNPSMLEGTLEPTEGKCRINPVLGPPMLLGFEEGKAEEVYEAMRKTVKVKVDPKTRKIERIEIQEQPSALSGTFFEAKSIDQLIAEQGVKPITDLAALSGALPDEQLDEMLEDIYSSRAV